MYTDINDSFPISLLDDHMYFIIFTDDYSYCGYLYLVHEKLQSLDMFKIYKAKVENQQKKD